MFQALMLYSSLLLQEMFVCRFPTKLLLFVREFVGNEDDDKTEQAAFKKKE
jgi:hypothetical protein